VFESRARKRTAMELRPLGFGEIFDRAVTLYIRNFVPFAAIVAVLIVPLAVLQYLVDVASQPQFDAILRVFTHPGSTPSGPVPTMFDSPGIVGLLIVLVLITYATWPFALNAVAVGVARLYRGRPVTFRACYDVALRRWLQTFGIIGVDIVIFLVWYLVAFVVIMAFVAVVSLFGIAAGPIAVFFGVLFAVIAGVVLLASLAPLVVALTFAMYAVVIEDRPVMESIALGFTRIFSRGEFWRAILFSVAAGAVMFGASAIFGFVGIVAAFAHLPFVQAAIESLSRAVIAPFGVVLLAIYYFDVRIRREAFDLEASLDRLTAVQPA
jgi:hypothetical protein